MPSTIIARRYAEAYFRLAEEKGDIDGWRAELARAVESVSTGEVQRALGNPRLGLNERVQLADDLLDGSSKEVRSLIRLLVERGRSREVRHLLAEYDRFADRARGIVHVEVTSAVPLPEAGRALVTKALAAQVRGTARTEFKEDPAIIGGLVIRIDDRVIDDSVRTHLQQLQATFA